MGIMKIFTLLHSIYIQWFMKIFEYYFILNKILIDYVCMGVIFFIEILLLNKIFKVSVCFHFFLHSIRNLHLGMIY